MTPTGNQPRQTQANMIHPHFIGAPGPLLHVQVEISQFFLISLYPPLFFRSSLCLACISFRSSEFTIQHEKSDSVRHAAFCPIKAEAKRKVAAKKPCTGQTFPPATSSVPILAAASTQDHSSSSSTSSICLHTAHWLAIKQEHKVKRLAMSAILLACLLICHWERCAYDS